MSSSKKMVTRSRARGIDSRNRTAASCDSLSWASMLPLVSMSRPRSRASASSWPGSTARPKSCTCWGRPFSSTVKSSGLRFETRRPAASRTVTVRWTSSSWVGKTGSGPARYASAVEKATSAAARVDPTIRRALRPKEGRRLLLGRSRMTGAPGPGRDSTPGGGSGCDPKRNSAQDFDDTHGQVHLVEGRHHVRALDEVPDGEEGLLGDAHSLRLGALAGAGRAHALADVLRDRHPRHLVVQELRVLVRVQGEDADEHGHPEVADHAEEG